MPSGDRSAVRCPGTQPGRPGTVWPLSAILVTVLSPPLLAVLVLFGPRTVPPEMSALFIDEALLAALWESGPSPKHWLPVPPPVHCPVAPAGEACDVRLRVRFYVAAADPGILSIYIPTYRGSLSVALNGTLLAQSDWTKHAAVIGSATPLLIPMPTPLVRPGPNEIGITLAERGPVPGFIGRFAIGPDYRLRPDHDRLMFQASTLQRMIDGWQLATAIILLILWLVRRDSVLLVFGTALLFQMSASVPAILGPSTDEAVARLANHGRFVSAALFLPMVWMFVGHRLPIPVWVFLLLPLAVVASHLAFSAQVHHWLLRHLFVPIVLLLVLATVFKLVRVTLWKRDGGAALLLGACGGGLVCVVHDVLVLASLLPASRPLAGRFAALFFVAGAAGLLVWRHAWAANTLDRFRSRLKEKVMAAEEALRQCFDVERTQIRSAVLHAERVRLMGDLHDGIAGQLVSALALCEGRGYGTAEVAAALRAALADLRLVVASLEDVGGDIRVMLALFRNQIEPQLDAHGVTLVWLVADLPALEDPPPGATLNILRILQEATMNAARHSGSDRVEIAAVRSNRSGFAVRLSVSDRGRGGAVPRAGGHGLRNMRRRAQALGAMLLIESTSGGTTVTLDLPVRLC